MNKLLWILLAACTACTTHAQGPQRAEIKGEPSSVAVPGDMLADIRRQIGTPSCTDSAQCRTLPVGARACGGPEDYLPYSTDKSDETALRALAERFHAERKASIAASGEMSTCMFKPDPGAVCVAGTCQLGSGAPST